MATEIGKLYYDLSINDTGLKSGLASADNSVDKTGSKFAGMGKAIGAGVAVAGAALVAFGISSVKAFTESENAIAQTNAVLKSTGGVAGVTADMVDKLASSLQRNSRFSDEQVRSAENMLLTFTKIGKDVFPEATQAVADMAQAMGQDLTQTSIQVGKALQDPVQGVTALQRVGVRLTDSQKELVKKMVAVGDTAGAQRLILAELKTEFGGSAEAAGKTFAGSLEKAKNQINDLQEAIGQAIVNQLTPLLNKFNEWFEKAGGVEGIMNKLKTAIDNLKVALDNAKPTLDVIVAVWRDVFKPALEKIWDIVENRLIPAFQKLKDKLDPIMPVVEVLGGLLLVLAFGPMAILTGFILGAIYAVSLLIGWIANLVGWVGNLAGIIWNAMKAVGNAIVDAFKWAFDKVKDIWSGITGFFGKVGEGIGNAMSSALEGVKNTVKAAVNWIIDKANVAIRGVNKVSPPGVPEIGEIPKLRTGVENFAGGLAFVHKGEMLMNLAPGTDVVKKSDVGAMMANGSGGNNITINLDGIMTESRDGTRRVAQNLVSAINEGLRASGKQEIGV